MCEAHDKARSGIYVNAAILGVGLLITWATYVAALNGGTYLVCTGAIVFGGYRLIRSLYYMVRIKSAIKQVKKRDNIFTEYANYLAISLGYSDYVDMETSEAKRIGFNIGERATFFDRVNEFSTHFGCSSFQELYEKTMSQNGSGKEV